MARPRAAGKRDREGATDGGRRKRPRAASAADGEEDERMLRDLAVLDRGALLGLPVVILAQAMRLSPDAPSEERDVVALFLSKFFPWRRMAAAPRVVVDPDDWAPLLRRVFGTDEVTGAMLERATRLAPRALRQRGLLRAHFGIATWLGRQCVRQCLGWRRPSPFAFWDTTSAHARAALAALVRRVGPLLGPVLFGPVMGFLRGRLEERFAAAIAAASLVFVPGACPPHRRGQVVATALMRGVLATIDGGRALPALVPGETRQWQGRTVGLSPSWVYELRTASPVCGGPAVALGLGAVQLPPPKAGAHAPICVLLRSAGLLDLFRPFHPTKLAPGELGAERTALLETETMAARADLGSCAGRLAVADERLAAAPCPSPARVARAIAFVLRGGAWHDDDA